MRTQVVVEAAALVVVGLLGGWIRRLGGRPDPVLSDAEVERLATLADLTYDERHWYCVGACVDTKESCPPRPVGRWARFWRWLIGPETEVVEFEPPP